MVDAADQEKVEASRNELHNLLDKPQLQGIPVSVDPKLFVSVCVFCVNTAAVKQNLCELQEKLFAAISGFFFFFVLRFWFSVTRGISPLL